MALPIDEAFLPAALTAPPMSDTDFAEFCAGHPDLFFETTAEGELLVMPPAHSNTGIRNSEISAQLRIWSRQDGRGLAGDSSTGFVLPNGARRSPDASWTLKTEVRKLPPESRDGYWHLCPAFALELRSATDRLRTLRAKMQEYIENGAQLGWLIDPSTQTVEIYRPNREPGIRNGIETIDGEGPVQGFTLDLRPVWDPFS
jgi:Uma2 family endonuclease